MSFIPNCQIHTCQTSLSRFHGLHLQFLRYNSTTNFSFYIPNYSFTSTPTPITQSNNSWIQRWDNPNSLRPPKQAQAVLDYRNGGVSSEDDESCGTSLSTSSSTMERIVEKLKKFGYVEQVNEKKVNTREKGSVEDIFYVEEGTLPNSRGGFSKKAPLGFDIDGDGEVSFPWEKPLVKEKEETKSVRRESKTSVAELTLPESEFRRLRQLGIRTKEKTKVSGAGVTQAVVETIHDKWKQSEVVRIKCEGAPALNMRRMHEILERRTGGLVIWRSGTSLCLYRGVTYELPSMKQTKTVQDRRDRSYTRSTDKFSRVPLEQKVEGKTQVAQGSSETELKELNQEERLPEVKYEIEIDKLLEDLGPRYTDWPGGDPLPVDADLLPSVIHGYKPPFRILPYGVRSTLGVKEATALRRLARGLPPHFALGRSREHHGLATAMVKLWEKSSIAKVALKRGVQLTTSERMAEDIKKLTGGIMLSRNKDFIVFYRGKNFLSPDVTEALLEREKLANTLQDEEEQARLRASSFFITGVETTVESGIAGSLGETLEADARWGKRLDADGKKKLLRSAEVARHANLVRKLERTLAFAGRKLVRAERALSKVEAFLKPVERPPDPESLTDEERFMFRKLGLKMKAFLLMGRRGVFDGTVENMHLHWKYRELVKVMVKAKTFDQVRNIALSLEAESGGVLVSVDKVSKGFAIIVFRGRDYQRPRFLRPKNLLTKRKALARSIELQRREALYNHVSDLQQKVKQLRSELDEMETVKDRGDEKLYSKLDSAYATEDEDTEEEGDEAYLETFGSESEDDLDASNDNFLSEADIPYDVQHESSDTDSEASNLYASVEPDI